MASTSSVDCRSFGSVMFFKPIVAKTYRNVFLSRQIPRSSALSWVFFGVAGVISQGMADQKPIALIDVKNMYVSCERLFDLSLRGKAIGIMSNGDGCLVARSDECKALGVAMGTPAFKVRHLVDNGSLICRSSNYSLYGDLSRRKQEVYADFSPKVEIYSIDESFVDFAGFSNVEDHGRKLVSAVARRVGLPTRVGIGPTRVMAKMANEVAKKTPIAKGVFDMMDRSVADWVMTRMDVGDIWGVGRATTRKLNALDIKTAADLRDMPLKQGRALGTVVLERIIRELRGEPCMPFEDVKVTKKGVAVTRSTGAPIRDFDTLMEAVASHATRVAEKLRHGDLVAGRLQVFYHTSRFKTSEPQHSVSRSTSLMPMSNNTLDLVKAAERCAEAGWIDGHPFAYSKVGVMCVDLVESNKRPRTLFEPLEHRDPLLMDALDAVNDRYGRKTLTIGREMAVRGRKQDWKQRADHLSPRYTTRLTDVPKLRRGRLCVA